MSAIDLLKSQHREVEKLFSQIEKAGDSEKKTQLFEGSPISWLSMPRSRSTTSTRR